MHISSIHGWLEYLYRVDAWVHTLGVILEMWRFCNEADIFSTYNVQGVTKRFYKFLLEAYSYLWHCCQRGRRLPVGRRIRTTSKRDLLEVVDVGVDAELLSTPKGGEISKRREWVEDVTE